MIGTRGTKAISRNGSTLVASSASSHQRQVLRSFSNKSPSSSSSSWMELASSYMSQAETTIPMDTGDAAEILVSDQILQTSHLERLMGQNALAIHVKQYYRPTEIAAALGAQMARQAREGKARNWKVMGGGMSGGNTKKGADADTGGGQQQQQQPRGLESTDVMTLGEHDPYNVAMATGNTAAYFSGVQQEFQKRRQPQSLQELLTEAQQGITPNTNTKGGIQVPVSILSPLDQVRLELDEAWPGGASLARSTSSDTNSNSAVFGGGLPRIMMGPTRWKRGLVHVDQLSPLSPTQGLFSANIYLQLPKTKNPSSAGVLEIWPVGIRSQWEWYKNAPLRQALSMASHSAEWQLKLRTWLGPPQVIENVTPGDLILLCAQRPHAAVGFTDPTDIRVSLQCFIQHHGPGKQLLIDC